MKHVQVGQLLAMVDDEDYERVAALSWSPINDRGRRYALSRKQVKRVVQHTYMHRLVMGVTDPRVWVDHIDGNVLNNTKANLRIASASENSQNSRPRGGSKFIGVSYVAARKKWKAGIAFQYVKHHLGFFDSETEAAIAYDKKCEELYGKNGRRNFHDHSPAEPTRPA